MIILMKEIGEEGGPISSQKKKIKKKLKKIPINGNIAHTHRLGELILLK